MGIAGTRTRSAARVRLAAMVITVLLVAGCDWSQQGFSLGRTYATSDIGLDPDRLAAVQVAWLPPETFTKTPVTGNGRVYGAGAARLQALAKDDGTLLWAFPCRQMSSGLAYASGLVFVVCLPDEPDQTPTGVTERTLFALDAATGDVRWSRRPTSVTGVGLADDRLIVWQGGARVESMSYDGTVEWTLEAPGVATVFGEGSTLWLRRSDGSYTLHRTDDGTKTAELPPLEGVRTSIANGRLYTVQDGHRGTQYTPTVTIRAYDAYTGVEQWRHDETCTDYRGFFAIGEIAVASDTVAFATASLLDHGTCTYGALDATTGELKWTQEPLQPASLPDVTISRDVVYFYSGNFDAIPLFGTDDGTFGVFRLTDGARGFELRPDLVTDTDVIIDGGDVILPNVVLRAPTA
jgi:outer membrane protein assembly factor BamB